MAKDEKDSKADKAAERKMPAGATNMHKNRAVGMSREEAEEKALTDAQVERKER